MEYGFADYMTQAKQLLTQISKAKPDSLKCL
jgi:hypothetical protein